MARKTVSKISVQVTADAAGLKRNLGEAGRTVRSFGGTVDRLRGAAAKITAIGTSITAGIEVVRIFTASLQGLADAIREVDQARREAENFGLTLRNFKALGLAAREAGVNFDTLVDAMTDLQERISLAGQGEKGPVALFRELGLSFKELAMLAPDEALAEVARALLLVENRADRTRIEMELLGGSAHEVDAALLSIARNGLDEYRTAAEGTNVLTQAQADILKELINSWDNFIDKITNVVLQISVTLGPALNSVVEYLDNMADGLMAVVEGFRWLGQQMGLTMGDVGDFATEAEDMLAKSGAGLSSFADDMKKAEEQAKKLAESRKKLAVLEERLAEMSRPEIVAGVARQAGAVVASSAEGAARRAQIAAGQFRAMAEEARARRRAEDSAKKREELLREIEAHSRRIAESSPVEVREVEIAG